MQCGTAVRPSLMRGFLLAEWVIALAVLGSFALLVIIFVQRQEIYINTQQERRQEARINIIERNTEWLRNEHRLFIELQEGD
ncbi:MULTISPECIES: hypothetical protein [Pseudidiomarina]|uniref:Uncharacterized protein n=1 Tax=Pseudidiomarina homiensis TaxID=364198 RepID=A0A432Y592_9GAMM|nr:MULTISPECIES: hypothetical protein [Pseudidiomarina]RUO56093.1 hypothetical protein CWI70_04850 [Pseudidiomarina homiensis]